MSGSGHRIALITDSTCDVPKELLERYNIYNVAQHVIWGTEDLRDGIELNSEQFYKRLATDPVHPKTSQPVAAEFAAKIEQARADGAEEAVVIALSSKLSGTHQSAVGAKEMVQIPVHVYDSRSVSMGLGWQVLAAARARENGADAAAMIAAADKVRQALRVYFVVDTLEYLHKGGRIGGAQRLLGTALNLKPQLVIDHENGTVEAGEKTRTRSKAIDRMVEAVFSNLATGAGLRVAVQHGAAEADAKALADRIQRDYQPEQLEIGPIATVLGVHAGPGALALCVHGTV